MFQHSNCRLFCFYYLLVGVELVFSFNDFPSLVNANASMAVVIEKSFYERKILIKEIFIHSKDAYEKSVASFTNVVDKIAREKMNISGLSIHVFQDIQTNLARDYMILLSVSTCQTAWNLFKRAKIEKLVHLAITDINCPRLPAKEGMSIPLVDPGEELPQIFYDLRVSGAFHWSKATFLHDDSIERETIGKIIQAFDDELPILARGLSTNSLFFFERGKSDTVTNQNIQNILVKFSTGMFLSNQFIVIVAHDTLSHVLQTARSLKMLNPSTQWLFIVPNMVEFPYGSRRFPIELLGEGENIAILYNETYKNYQNDIKYNENISEMMGSLAIAIEKVSSIETHLYGQVTEEQFEATGFSKLDRSQILLEYLSDQFYNKTQDSSGSSCKVDCDMNWILQSGLTWGNTIGSSIDTQPHKLIVTGIWTPDRGFVSMDHMFPHIYYGFRRKSLPIATYNLSPNLKEKNVNDLRGKWDGLIFDVINELSNKLNFTFKTVSGGNEPQMISTKNDSLLKCSMSAAEKVPSDVIELVRTKSVFIGACAITSVLYEKEKNVNFTNAISTQTYGLLTGIPQPQSRALLFTSPYSTQAWICIVISIIVVGPVLWAVHFYSPRRLRSVDDENSKNPGSASDYMWYIYGALLQQGGMHLPKSNGARLVVATWWLVVMVVVATYSGSLVAFLTFPKMEPVVKTIDDLLERREELTWSIPKDSLLDDYIKNSNQVNGIDYKNLLPEYDAHGQKHDTVSYLLSINKIKKGKHVVIDWLSSLRISIKNNYRSSGHCDFSLGTDVLLLQEPIFMLVPAGSPYLDIINIQLQRMLEAGLTNKWINDRMPTKDQCWLNAKNSNSAAANRKVNLQDMQGIFFVLFFGYITAVLFLCFEHYIYSRKIAKERLLILPFVL
ncbi:ionotropic receptor 93a [Aphidius gifuensis]|uniref:ionotropic receptor 93a n=1 Tax=Aphidius gifuensis TaxID=684658 RepID=UPI001CDC279B|nr:ionotropic receptor 93a [Aphidius gifuensis]